MEDTIAAIATPSGEAGLAVIRVSGPQCFAVVERCFEPSGRFLKPSSAPTHTLQYGHIHRQGRRIDEVLLGVMKAPRSFTREDVVEITCHGGMLPARSVLEIVLESGARLALPGEFTRRAFINGRIDLTQAEAVMDLIHARTRMAMAAANQQLAGKLSQQINSLRDELMRTLAHVEAHIDFPDEDIAPETSGALAGSMSLALEKMENLLRTAEHGRILRQGIRAAIIGRPNAGKSSLLNQLLEHNRAIVSPVPGTTRDTIEETANILGVPVILVDTAGLRDSGDPIEQEGMRRTRESYETAEFILHVLDGSSDFSETDARFLREFAGKKRILVRNKSDLPRRLELPAGLPDLIVDVSCVSGQGIEDLRLAARDLVWSGGVRADMVDVMINARHQDALSRARAALEQSLEALRRGETPELVAADLRVAVNAVGEVVGKTATEDLLDRIFSEFCIGK
jgi:tRNA modification GTPase